MELIYSMRRKPLKCEPPNFDNATDTETVRPLCTISTANIIAYSSPTELTDVDGDTWGGHVYVCDLDTPWNSYKVVSTAHPVSALEWDIEGKELLIGTTVGDVSVYGQKDCLLNEWQCLYSASFPGEHIIKAAFFHNGRRVVASDKKLEAPVTERVQVLRSTPTLKGFGGVGRAGAVVVTCSGLAGALVPRGGAGDGAGGGGVTTAVEPLRTPRDRVTNAAISHKNGNLLIAAICWSGGEACVRCFLCSPPRPPPPALLLQPLPTVYLLDNSLPVSISWTLREDSDSLLIAGAGAALSLWKCTEKAHPVHKLLSKGPVQDGPAAGGGPKPVSDSFNTVVWARTAAWEGPGGGAGERAACVASARLPLGAPHAVLATRGALHLLARGTLHLLCSRPVATEGAPGLAPEAPAAGTSSPKKPKYGQGVVPNGGGGPGAGAGAGAGAARGGGGGGWVTHVEVSWLGGVAVCVDTHAQLHVYRLPQPWADIPSAACVGQAVCLLEYGLVAGYDALDLLLTFRQNFIEPLYERVTEMFVRQPPAFQQYYYQSYLKLKIALCRVSGSLQGSASALTCVLTCHAVLAACGAALRDERDAHAPPIEDDDDKSLSALEAKPELLCEGPGGALGALRLGLQRAADIALTAVAHLAHPPHHALHGHEVWSEPATLALLRKLVVVGRAGGRGGDALSRLLARLAHHPHPHRHELYEEWVAVSGPAPAPRVWEALPRCNVSSPHQKPFPLYLEYGAEPEGLRYCPEPPAPAQADSPPAVPMDSIRYMYLGGGSAPARWRQCGRCGARALPAHAHAPQRHALQRAADARFLPTCRCGGMWALCKNV